MEEYETSWMDIDEGVSASVADEGAGGICGVSKSDYHYRRELIGAHMSVAVTAMVVQHHWLRRAPWGTAADRFRRRAHQPDLRCCRHRRHCCGGAG